MTALAEDEWEPELCPDFATQMPNMAANALCVLTQATTANREAFLLNPCDQHKELFSPFASGRWINCAGNYRGADLDGVRDYNVHLSLEVNGQTKNDIQFAKPEIVACRMKNFTGAVKRYCNQAQTFSQLRKASSEAVNLIIQFLAIHPFANGNGHITRLMFPVLVSLTRYKVKAGWTVNPSPYDNNIKSYFMLAMNKTSDEQEKKERGIAMNELRLFFQKWVKFV